MAAVSPGGACSSPAATAASTTSSSSAPAASTSSAATAAAVVGVRGSAVPRHLHAQLAPVEERAVHGVHRVLGIALVVEPHEGEPAALFRVAVPRDVHVAYAAVLLEHAPEGLGRRAVR